MRTLLAALLLTVGMAGAAAAATASQCFRSSDYQGFKPIDERAFIVRAELNAYYRIEVQGTCPGLVRPAAALVTTVRGTDMICGPLDWDLKVGQLGSGGFVTGCIVKSQRRLSPAEVAALPPAQRP